MVKKRKSASKSTKTVKQFPAHWLPVVIERTPMRLDQMTRLEYHNRIGW